LFTAISVDIYGNIYMLWVTRVIGLRLF